jgi:uracil-DNA glycosylase family 4
MARAHKAQQAVLEWYVDNGVDEAWLDAPANRFAAAPKNVETLPMEKPAAVSVLSSMPAPAASPETLLGKSDARSEAIRLAAEASTLDELREAIASFDGLAIRKTATNMVFCDGNPKSPVMLVGEAPGADEDRLGKPFVGVSGQLLDRILKCINLDRTQEDPLQSVYISNILNWRPPGNRTPSPAEIEVSLPFIEKHIALVKPKILIFCGSVSAKALLNSSESVSKLRKTWHAYRPQTRELNIQGDPIPAIATYHPAYLLRTPSQKKAVWADMLAIERKLKELN